MSSPGPFTASMFGFALVAGACDASDGGSVGVPASAPAPDVVAPNVAIPEVQSPAADCPRRCVAKATACGAPGDLAQAPCANVCAKQPTEEALRCFEAQACTELQSTFSGGTLPCGIGAVGGYCTNERPYCDGDVLVSCSRDDAGTPIEVRETCPARCEDARCVSAAELCEAGFAPSGCDIDECNMSGTVVVNGVHYCTSTCGPNDVCPTGTACFRRPNQPSICLPPCTPGRSGDCPTGFLDVPCGAEGACGR